MHIEPGLVDSAKIGLSYATAAAASGYTLNMAWTAIRERGIVSLLTRSTATAALVFAFFELLPHPPVGVSEVHLIFGSTLFLLFGAAPAAIGLALGLLIQGLLFAPFDLPQYGMNVTTLLVPLFAMSALARRIIRPDTAYIDLSYRQTLALSAAYQAGIVAWVAFWAVYGRGFEAENLQSVGDLRRGLYDRGSGRASGRSGAVGRSQSRSISPEKWLVRASAVAAGSRLNKTYAGRRHVAAPVAACHGARLFFHPYTWRGTQWNLRSTNTSNVHARSRAAYMTIISPRFPCSWDAPTQASRRWSWPISVSSFGRSSAARH